jgi:hypothetical protein
MRPAFGRVAPSAWMLLAAVSSLLFDSALTALSERWLNWPAR